MKRFMPFLVGALACVACNSVQESGTEAAKGTFVEEKVVVDTMMLKKSVFYKEIAGTGVAKAARRAEIAFDESGGVVEKVYVKNGDYVGLGAPIAKLDERALLMKVDNAKESLERAKLDFYDKVIGYGYGRDTSHLPKELLEVAKVRSGLTLAELQYAEALANLNGALLRAPFPGVVANISVKPFERSSSAVCVIIDNSLFNVQFSILETELKHISRGQRVKMVPFADGSNSFTGVIKEINPVVDDNGQVLVSAEVKGIPGMVDGMSLRILIEIECGEEFVVPKSAVVMRDGYDVVFLVDASGRRAKWLYVDVVDSNSSQYAIAGCKAKGSKVIEGTYVITEGNLNLADGSNVEIKERCLQN